MPMSDARFWLADGQVLGNSGSEYSDDDINFGYAGPNINRGGGFGLHMLITTTYTTLDSGCILWIVHSASVTPTVRHTGTFIAVARMVKGNHFYVPCGSEPLLQYARAWFEVLSENAGAGASDLYFGPPGPWGVASVT